MLETLETALSKYLSVIKIALALALVAGACYLTYTVTDSRWQSKYDKQAKDYSDASALAQQQARDKEAEYAANLQKANEAGAERVAQAQADATAATNAISRLRTRINKILADSSAQTTGVRQSGKTPGEALNLLADVLQKSLDRNGQLAEFADKSWNAAQQCYDSYNATQ